VIGYCFCKLEQHDYLGNGISFFGGSTFFFGIERFYVKKQREPNGIGQWIVLMNWDKIGKIDGTNVHLHP
jgi:hypothetical protein